ncbi:hypothetical protein [Micromonospora sp. RTGN7]|uniref:hypothetical protein n=1 Tax=Micromonospora sp. RTGN7 TaxID=3016526 RepID=UPI0029FF04A3|nr:hypothetical protein [Micromonospora sp. RTGN7]
MDADETTPAALPPGDITWDGTTLTAGGVVLAPGRYRLGDTDHELLVVEGGPDDDV